MKYGDFLLALKDERFLALTALVCNTCYFNITQKHDKMSKRVGVQPHKGDIIKLLRKEKKSNPAIENMENRPGDIADSDEDDDENEMERDAYIVDQRVQSRPVTALSRGFSGIDKKSSFPDSHVRLTMMGSDKDSTVRYGEELSVPRNPSSTHYTDFRNSRQVSAKKEFSIKKLPKVDLSKRSGLDLHQALQANLDPVSEAKKPKIPRVQSSHPALRYSGNKDTRPLTQSRPLLITSAKRL